MSDPLDMMGQDEEPTAPFWMTTFSDMVTLLLTFFVLIVAMSEVEVKKFQEALSYFQGHLGVLQNSTAISSMTRHVSSESVAREQAEYYETLLEYLKENALEEKIEVRLTDLGVHVVITDSIMFRSGEAALLPAAETILGVVSGIVAHGTESVVVEGHTDDRPIATARFPSNWELSAARAASVVRFLLEQEDTLAPERYSASGYGEYRPEFPNDTPEHRARNRRVEILFSWKPWQKEVHPYLQTLQVPAPSL